MRRDPDMGIYDRLFQLDETTRKRVIKTAGLNLDRKFQHIRGLDQHGVMEVTEQEALAEIDTILTTYAAFKTEHPHAKDA
jgi:hypothetical protein